MGFGKIFPCKTSLYDDITGSGGLLEIQSRELSGSNLHFPCTLSFIFTYRYDKLLYFIISIKLLIILICLATSEKKSNSIHLKLPRRYNI